MKGEMVARWQRRGLATGYRLGRGPSRVRWRCWRPCGPPRADSELTWADVSFETATTDVTFTLDIPDSTEVLLMPQLVAGRQAVAPGLKLLLHTTDRHRILEDLDSGRVDLGSGVFDQGQRHHKRRILNKENLMCVVNSELAGVTPPITLDDYVRLPYLLTSLIGSAYGVVDEALAKAGRTRTIALTSTRFTPCRSWSGKLP